MVGAELVTSKNEIMLITTNGTVVRTRVSEISVVSRHTQGVKLIRLGKDEKLVEIEKVSETEDALDEEVDEEIVEESGEAAVDTSSEANTDSDGAVSEKPSNESESE